MYYSSYFFVNFGYFMLDFATRNFKHQKTQYKCWACISENKQRCYLHWI